MKISEIIKELIKLKEKHGDLECYSGGEDYPGKVGWVTFGTPKAYYPEKHIKIIAKD